MTWKGPAKPDFARCPQCGDTYDVMVDGDGLDTIEVQCLNTACRVWFSVPRSAPLGRRYLVKRP